MTPPGEDGTTPMERDAQRLRAAVEDAVERVREDLEVAENVHVGGKHFNGEVAIVKAEGRAEK